MILGWFFIGTSLYRVVITTFLLHFWICYSPVLLVVPFCPLQVYEWE